MNENMDITTTVKTPLAEVYDGGFDGGYHGGASLTTNVNRAFAWFIAGIVASVIISIILMLISVVFNIEFDKGLKSKTSPIVLIVAFTLAVGVGFASAGSIYESWIGCPSPP